MSFQQGPTQLSAKWLLLLTLFVVVRQFTWSLLNPLFQGPDEVVHIQMVAQMDKHGLLFYRLINPVTWRDFEASYDFKEDWYHQKGIIWHLESKPTYIESSRWGMDEKSNLHRSNFDRTAAAEYYPAQSYHYPPLYYWLTGKVIGVFRAVGSKLITYQYGMRLVQSVFYLIFIAAAFWLSREVIQDRLSFLWTFSCILFHPMFIFMGSVVNNDNGLLPFSLLLLLGGIRLLKHPEHRGPMWLMAFAGISLILVKTSGFILVLAVYPIVSVLLALSRQFVTAIKLMPGFITCSALFLWLPTWIGQYGLYGGTPGSLALSQYLAIIFGWLGWNMAKNWLGQFAWFEINFPVFVYIIFIALLGAFSVVSLVHLARGSAKRAGETNLKLFLLLYLTLFAVVLGTFAYQYFAAARYGVFIQGRHILYALPLVYLCSGMILSRTISQASQKWVIIGGYIVASSILLFLVSLSVAGLCLIGARFFWDAGISFKDMVYRVMQYKPAFMKSDMGFAALMGGYLVGHLGLLIYFVWFGRNWVGRAGLNLRASSDRSLRVG